MEFDYNKLRGRITEIFGTQLEFASKMGMSERTLSLKLQGHRPWKQPDIYKAAKLLMLSANEISTYFFMEKIQNFEQKGKVEGEVMNE